MKLNKACRSNFTHEDIFKCANSRLGWYRRSTGNIVNFLLSPIVLGIKKGDRPGLVNPLIYYLEIFVILYSFDINVEPYTRPVRTVQWEGR